MENKQDNTSNPLADILQKNNLHATFYELLSNNGLDFDCLLHLTEDNETDDLCQKLGLDIIQKLKFKKLLKKIQESSNTRDEHYNRMHISDEVHDYIEIPEDIKIIIDTPEFQRLRELKQLGATYFVFPCATHNRFEHSLGVMHLARKLMLNLKMNQAELKITNNELYCVSAAGLLHDLGHGPFSHVFDHEFVPSMTSDSFRHEDMSIKLIKKLFVDNKIAIDKKLLELICALVSPSTHTEIVAEYKAKNRGFLFEIIANEANGIDVDKWDYFLRDSHNLSLDISFKYTRLLTHCRVIRDHICFNDKTNYDVQILFNTRYDLFKRVYSHKTSKAVEYMICDILRFANDKFKITEKTQNAGDFMELTDNIISRIQWTPITVSDHNTSDRKANENLSKAQALIRRIQKRDLYKCVAYILLESRTVAIHETILKKNNHNICIDDTENDNNDNDIDIDTDSKEDHDDSSDVSFSNKKIDYHFVENAWRNELFSILKKENLLNRHYLSINEWKKENLFARGMEKTDIICQLMSISYGSEREHPLKNVFFYNARGPEISKRIEMDQVTTLHDPSKFREVIFRVYVKNKQWTKITEQAFKIFCKQKKLIDEKKNISVSLGLSPKTSTPVIHKNLKRRNLNQTFDSINQAFAKPPSPPLIATSSTQVSRLIND